jgi:prepilin-type N-terminal cleavage/methylation domain-containing protein
MVKSIQTKAFTLAEVLITLGIIGVVVALTMPTLITQYKRIVLENQFKKAYSELNQVIKLWQDDEEDIYGTYYHAWDGNGTELRNAFYKYLKGSYLPKNVSSHPYYTSAKNSTTRVHYCPSSCCGNFVNSQAFMTVSNITYYACSRDGVINFAFDINGYEKGPNKWGIDYFDVELTSEDKLRATSIKYHCNAYYHGSANSDVNDGYGCTYLALTDKNYFKKIEL